MKPTDHPSSQSKVYRAVTYAFGILFVMLGLAIFVVAEFSLGSLIAGVLVGAFGLDAIVNTFRNKMSLLARIGPLP
jgi:hypothetical protein